MIDCVHLQSKACPRLLPTSRFPAAALAFGGGGPFTSSSWSISGMVLQSGINVITVTAYDVAGNSGTATLTITYNSPNGSGDDMSGMTAWAGNWLKLTLFHSGQHKSPTTAYPKILSWDRSMRILQTNLYSADSTSRLWEISQLPLRYVSGVPLRFLFSFDYAGLYGFSGRLSGVVDGSGTLVLANLRPQGVYISTEDDERDSARYEDVVTIKGRLIPASRVPQQIQNQRSESD